LQRVNAEASVNRHQFHVIMTTFIPASVIKTILLKFTASLNAL